MNKNLNDESCNDSETKQNLVCPACGEKFDGELPKWVSGVEECPNCDNVFHVDATE